VKGRKKFLAAHNNAFMVAFSITSKELRRMPLFDRHWQAVPSNKATARLCGESSIPVAKILLHRPLKKKMST